MDKCPITGKECLKSDCIRYEDYYGRCEVDRKIRRYLYASQTNFEQMAFTSFLVELIRE